MSTEYKVPVWPRGFRAGADRTLAWLDAESMTITTEQGEIIDLWPSLPNHAPIADTPNVSTVASLESRENTLSASTGSTMVALYTALRSALFQHNLLLFSPEPASLSFLAEAIRHGDAVNWRQPRPPGTGAITGLRCKQGSRVRHLVDAAQWDLQGPGDLPRLRRLYDHVGAGVFTTPGALGQATMRQLLHPVALAKGEYLKRPPFWAWQEIHDHLIGGRAELFQPGARFDELWECDQSSAYAAAIRAVPRGRCVHVRSREAFERWPLLAGVLRCRWSIVGQLALGLLGVRVEGGDLAFPVSGGPYEGWYALPEVKAAEDAGIEVEVLEGYGWEEVSDLFAPWSEHMDRLKLTADEDIRPLIKQVIVAGIGRFGMDRWEYTVHLPDALDSLTEEQYAAAEIVADAQTGERLWVVVKSPVKPDRNDLLIHVAAYVHANTRLALRARALPLAEAGKLVALNFDAFYATARPQGRSGWKCGAWKSRKLHHVKLPANRHLVSDEKVVMPGINRSGSMRVDVTATGQAR